MPCSVILSPWPLGTRGRRWCRWSSGGSKSSGPPPSASPFAPAICQPAPPPEREDRGVELMCIIDTPFTRRETTHVSNITNMSTPRGATFAASITPTRRKEKNTRRMICGVGIVRMYVSRMQRSRKRRREKKNAAATATATSTPTPNATNDTNTPRATKRKKANEHDKTSSSEM